MRKLIMFLVYYKFNFKLKLSRCDKKKRFEVPFLRDETLSRRNGTSIQYRLNAKLYRLYLSGTGSKFRFFETKFRPEETELQNASFCRTATVLIEFDLSTYKYFYFTYSFIQLNPILNFDLLLLKKNKTFKAELLMFSS